MMHDNPFYQELQKIQPPDEAIVPAIQAHLDQLTKPPGSLGELEGLCLWLGRAQQTAQPQAAKKRVILFAGDHGVTASGVSPYPSEVTGQMVANMLAGGAACSVLAKAVGAELQLVDVGVKGPLAPHPQLIQAKVAPGTANLAVEPAMTKLQCVQAISLGWDLARQAKDDGVDVLGTGEMGIGNSTPAAALYSAILGFEADRIAGRGTGLNDAGLERKIMVIEQALQLHLPACDRPFETLRRLGGLEIAALTGCLLGAAANKLPVIVDGFIVGAAAAVALALAPQAKNWLLFSHQSAEGGHALALQAMEVSPLLRLKMRLGEATGALVAMQMIDLSLALYHQMASFQSAGVSGKE